VQGDAHDARVDRHPWRWRCTGGGDSHRLGRRQQAHGRFAPRSGDAHGRLRRVYPISGDRFFELRERMAGLEGRFESPESQIAFLRDYITGRNLCLDEAAGDD